MKRGRPNVRNLIQSSILETLSSTQFPMTISALAKIISTKHNRSISWNTIEKYLNELTEMNKIQPMPLPHSKIEGKTGLTVYQLKK
jgi:hypothetical protein